MKQRRLTVAFRVILAIPHFLFLWVLSIVSQIVIIISWFIAIFLGRIPEGMHSFITRVVRYVTRVYAYELLLTDRYPPFDLSSEDYPVSVDVPQSRLSRLAVFFRIVLQIPASLLLLLVSAGLQIASFFIWLIVLIVGSMPRSLFEAVAATLRFQTRYYAYMALLTPTYPSGLFGDRPGGQGPPASMATPVPPAPVAPPSWQEDRPPPAYPSTPPAYPSTPPAPAPTTRPRATRLLLSRGGKRLVVLFIILGVLYFGGITTAAITLGGNQSRVADVQDARANLYDAVRHFQEQSATCQRQADLACQQTADRDLSTAFTNFNDDLSVVDFSRSQQAAATDCEAAASQMAAFLDDQSSATTPRPDALSRFEQLGNNFDQAYRRLIDSL